MTHDEMNQKFELMRGLLHDQANKMPEDAEAQKMAGFLLIGMFLLQGALGDLKRVADSLEYMQFHR